MTQTLRKPCPGNLTVLRRLQSVFYLSDPSFFPSEAQTFCKAKYSLTLLSERQHKGQRVWRYTNPVARWYESRPNPFKKRLKQHYGLLSVDVFISIPQPVCISMNRLLTEKALWSVYCLFAASQFMICVHSRPYFNAEFEGQRLCFLLRPLVSQNGAFRQSHRQTNIVFRFSSAIDKYSISQ